MSLVDQGELLSAAGDRSFFRGRPHPPADGFTLVEVMLVLALLGAFVLVGFPALSRFSGNDMGPRVRRVTAMFRAAQGESIARKQLLRVRYDPHRGELVLEAQQPDLQFSPVQDAVQGRLRLPERWTLTATGQDGRAFNAEWSLLHYPDGSRDPATLLLINPDGKTRDIRLPRLFE